MKDYLIGLTILLVLVALVYWPIIKFHRYDYRTSERTGKDERPEPRNTEDDWIQEWEYDPETKSFKHK